MFVSEEHAKRRLKNSLHRNLLRNGEDWMIGKILSIITLTGILFAGSTNLVCRGGKKVMFLFSNGREVYKSYRQISDPYIRLFAGKTFYIRAHMDDDWFLNVKVNGEKLRFVDKAMGTFTDNYGIAIFGLGRDDDDREIKLVQNLKTGKWSGSIINDKKMIFYKFSCRKTH
jgi:hypothetical protein